MTENKREDYPDYFVLNPLTTNKKLGNFFFKNNDYSSYKYYPHYIHGTMDDVPDEKINDFVKRFFSKYTNDPPDWKVTNNNKLK